jgi:NADH:ubiquinone oxidoreductase subunit 3 (subunit A)
MQPERYYLMALHIDKHVPILGCIVILLTFILTGQRIGKIASNNADYSYVGQRFESGNSTRYLYELLSYLNIFKFEMGVYFPDSSQ